MDALNSPAWNKYKEAIHQLYLLNRPSQTAEQVRKELERRGFKTTKSKLNAQLTAWGFEKNLKKKDWPCIEYHISKRGKQQKLTEVFFNGRAIPRATVIKSIGENRYSSSRAAGGGQNPKIPPGVTLRTPLPSPTISPRMLEQNHPISSMVPNLQIPPIDLSAKRIFTKGNRGHLSTMSPNIPVSLGNNDLIPTTRDVSSQNKCVTFASAGLGSSKPLNLPSVDFLVELRTAFSHAKSPASYMSFISSESLDMAIYPLDDNTWPAEFSTDAMSVHSDRRELALDQRRFQFSTVTSGYDLHITEVLCRLANNHLTGRESDAVFAKIANHPSLMRLIISMRGFTAQTLQTKLLETVCQNGWSSDLKFLINNGINISLLSGLNGGRLLQMTLHRNDNLESRYEIVKYLLESGASPNPPTRHFEPYTGESPLYFALIYGHLSATRELLAAGAKLRFLVENRNIFELPRAIKSSMELENLEMIKLWIDSGALDLVQIDELHPLEWASLHATKTVHETLLRSGITVLSPSLPALMLRAALEGSAAFESFLISKRCLDDLKRNEALRGALYLFTTLSNHETSPEETLLRIFSHINPSIAAVRDSIGRIEHHFLRRAVQQGLDGCVETLIEAGVEIDQEVFLEACELRQNTSILGKLLEWGVDLELWSHEGLKRTLNNFPSFKLLVEKGADINSRNIRGLSILQYAMRYPSPEHVLYLIEKGANLNPLTTHDREESWSILHSAAAFGDLAMFKMVLEAGANIIPGEGFVGPDTLFDACSLEIYSSLWSFTTASQQIFELLLEKKAPIVRDFQWQSQANPRPITFGALQKLISSRAETSWIFRFINAGADVNDTDHHGVRDTPLCVAIQRGDLKIIAFLLDKGADVNLFSATCGRTPLQEACGSMDSSEAQQFAVVKLLLARGADVEAKPDKEGGITALQGAAISGFIGIATLLLEVGAEPNAEGAAVNGRMALDAAAEWGRLEMVQLLLNKGANSGRKGGITGYDEAIRLAEEEGHWAVAKLILRHHEVQQRGYPEELVSNGFQTNENVHPAMSNVMNDDIGGFIEELDTGMVW